MQYNYDLNKKTLRILKARRALLEERVKRLNLKNLRLVPRIRFSMTHSLSDFRQHDCERKEPTTNDMPAVRFVPDKPASRSFVTFTVYDDNDNKEMEVKIQQFHGEGPLEDLLLWWLSVLKYIALKPANSPDLKFALIPKCLFEGGTI